MDPVYVISILGGLIVILLLVGAPVKPVRIIGQSVAKILIGALLLFFLNAFGTSIGLHIPINFVTSVISGLLGLPGIAALVIIQKYII